MSSFFLTLLFFPASLSSSFSPYPSSPFSLRMLCVHVSYHDIITSPTDYIQLYYMCVCVCTCVCLINMYYNGVYICVIIVLIIVDNGLSHAVLTRDGVTSFTIIKLTDISTAYSLPLPLIRACIAPHTSHLPAAVCLTLFFLSLSCRTLLRRRSSTYAAVNRQNSSVGTGDAPPPPANKW